MNMRTAWSGADDGDERTEPNLVWLDGWLRADVDVEPPAGYASRVIAYVDAELGRVPPWRRALLTIGVLLSGGVLVAWTASQLFLDWHQTMQDTPMAAVALDVASGVAVALLAFAPPPAWFAGRGALYGLASVAVAVLWFGVTVAPRTLAQRAQLRRRP